MEQPLPFNGACNIGSLDLSKFLVNKQLDYARLEIATRVGIRFLNAVAMKSVYPTPEISQWVKDNMPVALGIMGFADYLLMREIAYGSQESITELETILERIYTWAKCESEELGRELGVPVECAKLPEPRRNITLTTVAPTGCQRGDTLVVTNSGIYELSELGDVNGDTWQDLRGVNVSQEVSYKAATKFFVNGERKTKKLLLSSGAELESTLNHQYRVLDNGKYLWKEAGDIAVTDLLVVPLGTYQATHETHLVEAPAGYYNEKVYSFPTKVTKDLAEFLGILFGDGSFHHNGVRLHLNSTEEDYLYVAELGKRVLGIVPTMSFDKRMNTVSVCFNSRALLRWLEVNDFVKSKSKHILFTKKIRTFNRENLKAFMDGFYFADGSCNNSSKYIDTASKKFAQQWVTLSRALGTDCRISTHRSGLGSLMYRVHFIKEHRIIETKEIRNALNNLGLTNCTVDTVIEVQDSSTNTYDIEVPDNNCYLANGVVSHNTVSLIAGCSSGIEPVFSEVMVRTDKTGTYTFESDLAHKPYFRCAVSANGATEVTLEEHVRILAAAQKHIDSGVSKTCNCPTLIHRESMAKALMLAWELGCKGVAMYRNGSRKTEVLTPKNIKRNKCPKCGSEIIKIFNATKCVACEWELNEKEE